MTFSKNMDLRLKETANKVGSKSHFVDGIVEKIKQAYESHGAVEIFKAVGNVNW